VPTREIVIAGKEGGEDTRALLRALRRRFLPDAVVVLHPEGKTGKEIEKLVSYVKGQEAIEGKAAAYVCENYACALPVTNVGELEALLDERR
jgi:uncharacterized protein YyaL (SSP411 family)